MNTSDKFETCFDPAPRRVGRSPRIARNKAELKMIEQRYIRMGFDAREARFKAYTYHSMKL